jgi:pantoate kinase
MYTIANRYQSQKINLFYKTETVESPRNNAWVTENRNPINTLVDSYANQAISLLEKNPEVQQSLMNAIKSMSESVLTDPDNIKKLLEKVQNSDKIDSKSKTWVMILILEKHAELTKNTEIQNQITTLKAWINSGDIHIRTETSKKTHEVLEQLRK